MAEASQFFNQIEQGDPNAADQLLCCVYDELRQMAQAQLRKEKPGQTLQATALVHEAYLRLIGDGKFENHGHFFAAAAEAMRRILVDAARRRAALKRGGGIGEREALDSIAAPTSDDDVLGVHECVDELARVDAKAATLVKLRFFSGMKMDEVAAALDISVRSAHDIWAYARTWLHRKMRDSNSGK